MMLSRLSWAVTR